MKVKLNDGQSALDADIEHLEREIGHRLPPPYSEFLRQYDGAKPDPNRFHINGIDRSGREYVNDLRVNTSYPSVIFHRNDRTLKE